LVVDFGLGKLLKSLKRAMYPASQGALAGKISEIAEKATPLTWLPEASLSDFHWDDFYISLSNRSEDDESFRRLSRSVALCRPISTGKE